MCPAQKGGVAGPSPRSTRCSPALSALLGERYSADLGVREGDQTLPLLINLGNIFAGCTVKN